MAVGIGLVFGVLRLVNFAYGQLVMAGAFALALASQWGWPVWAGIVLCFAVVLALSVAMEWLVFRPLRGALTGGDARRHVRGRVPAPEHRAALVRLAREDRDLAHVPRPLLDDLGVDIRKIAIVAVIVAAVCLLLLSCCSSGRRSACTCARRRWTSRRRACSAFARTASSRSRCSSPARSRRSSP